MCKYIYIYININQVVLKNKIYLGRGCLHPKLLHWFSMNANEDDVNN